MERVRCSIDVVLSYQLGPLGALATSTTSAGTTRTRMEGVRCNMDVVLSYQFGPMGALATSATSVGTRRTAMKMMRCGMCVAPVGLEGERMSAGRHGL